jgi:hypothetical protein
MIGHLKNWAEGTQNLGTRIESTERNGHQNFWGGMSKVPCLGLPWLAPPLSCLLPSLLLPLVVVLVSRGKICLSITNEWVEAVHRGKLAGWLAGWSILLMCKSARASGV